MTPTRRNFPVGLIALPRFAPSRSPCLPSHGNSSDFCHSPEPSEPATLLRRWRCILLVQSTSIGLWAWTGRRLHLPLEHHTRRCGRFHHSPSISDGTSAKKSRKGPEGLETYREADFRRP